MDPLSGLSLVGCVIQLVEYATRVSSEFYGADCELSVKTNLDEITTHLKSLLSTVEAADLEGIPIWYCNDILQELQESLVYSSPRAKSIGFHDKISLLRQQLPALALKSIRGWRDLQTPAILNTYTDPHSTKYNLPNRVDRRPEHIHPQNYLGPALIHLLTSNIPAPSRELYKKNLKDGILAEIYNGTGQLVLSTQTFDPAWEKEIQHSFLRQLQYPGMGDQQAEIRDAYGSTCKWILEPAADIRGFGTGFRKWLSDSRPMYWIRGKSGAGKSTLMKTMLASKCFKSRGIVASFFFSSSRRPNQTSSASLLRSILHQVLSQIPKIIPVVAFSRWEALSLFGEDPKPLESAELLEILTSALHQYQGNSKIFIFVDALDECENCSNNSETIQLLHKISACPDVKVCVSSRPLPRFQDLIDGSPGLTLEDCTETDIENFLVAKIDTFQMKTSRANMSLGVKETVIHELATMASGCFLWAVIVVGSLQSKLMNWNEGTDLLDFVKNFPLELNGLFRSFLHELDASDPFVASIVRLLSLSCEPVSSVRLALLELNFPGLPSLRQTSSLSSEQLYVWTKESVKRTASKSRGLLEISWSESQRRLDGVASGGFDTHIILIHQSVRDFLEEEENLASCSIFEGSHGLVATKREASLSLLWINPIDDLTISCVLAEAICCAYTAMFTWVENEENVMGILNKLEQTCDAMLRDHVPLKAWTSVNCSSSRPSPAKEIEKIKRIKELDFWRPITPSVARGGKISARVQSRSIFLCSKYGLEPSEVQKMIFQSSDCLGDPNSACFLLGDSSEWSLFVESQQRLSSSKEENTLTNGIATANWTEGSSRHNKFEVPLTKYGGESFGCPQFNLTKGEFHEGNTCSDDDSDDTSWESFSSAEESLDEDHPLIALEAEATEVLLQGFMKYRQKHANTALAVSRVSYKSVGAEKDYPSQSPMNRWLAQSAKDESWNNTLDIRLHLTQTRRNSSSNHEGYLLPYLPTRLNYI